MVKEKTKVYLYTRVSTSMQIDGYSLDAQKSRIRYIAVKLLMAVEEQKRFMEQEMIIVRFIRMITCL